MALLQEHALHGAQKANLVGVVLVTPLQKLVFNTQILPVEAL